MPGGSGGGSSQDAQQAAAALAQMARASGPSLAEVLKPEVMLPLLQVTKMLVCHGCEHVTPSEVWWQVL